MTAYDALGDAHAPGSHSWPLILTGVSDIIRCGRCKDGLLSVGYGALDTRFTVAELLGLVDEHTAHCPGERSL